MTKLSRKVEYALMALKYMVERDQGSLISAKDVSDALSTPFEGTAKILQNLSSGKILQSEKGLQGGYRLFRPLTEISLHQLIEVIDGPTNLVKCIQTDSICEIQGTCNIASPLSVLNGKIQSFYQNITLAELLQKSASVAPQRSQHLEANT